MKKRTTVYVSSKLKDLAKQQGLCLSLILERALNIALAIPSEEKTMSEERDKLLIKANILGEKLEVAKKKNIKEFAKKKNEAFVFDLMKVSKIYFSKEAYNTPSIRAKPIDEFCSKHNLTRDKAIDLILHKRKTKKAGASNDS